jgi:DNA-directed RNA polymerase specialized sigma24 family protein
VENQEFQKLLRSVRAGDEQATACLVSHFEPYLLRVIRLRLNGSHLRHEFDSRDIWQSILARFFAGARHGEFVIESPADLAHLLTTMARNKIISKWRGRRQQAERLGDERDIAVENYDPRADVEQRDLVAAIRARLSAAERWLFDQQKIEKRS